MNKFLLNSIIFLSATVSLHSSTPPLQQMRAPDPLINYSEDEQEKLAKYNEVAALIKFFDETEQAEFHHQKPLPSPEELYFFL